MADKSHPSSAFGFVLNHEPTSYLRMLLPYGRSLMWGGFLLLSTNLIMVSLPLLINGAVSIIEKNTFFVLPVFGYSVNFNSIYMVLFAIILLALFGAVMRTLSRMVVFDIGRMVERDIRKRLFFQLSVYDESFFVKNSVGDLMNHLTTDINNIRMMMGFGILNIINIIFIFCFTIPLLIKIDAQLAFWALLPFPLVMLATTRISKQIFLTTIGYQEALSDMVSHIQENLLGAHVVRLFHQQEQESHRFVKTNEKTFNAGVQLAWARVLLFPVMRLMVGVSVGLVLYMGGKAIMAGSLSIGEFVEINARILQLSWPAMSVGFVLSISSRGKASIKRINQLLAYKPMLKDGPYQLNQINSLHVHKLRLNPKLAPHETLSFSIKKGEVLGLVGPSGSYKTQLLKILYRQIPVASGTVFFDEHDSYDLSLALISQNIAVVSQEPFLFHTTIRDNICFAKPDATEDEILEVIKIVRFDRDLLSFSEGLNTIVGERGITLSGGQRQRIALARALLAKRSVLIMDDALSSVDAQTEAHIILALQNFIKDSIVIIATHRLLAIKNAHEIIILKDGAQIGYGTHDELIKTSELYHSLWSISAHGVDHAG